MASQTSRHYCLSSESAELAEWRSPHKPVPLGSASLPWRDAALQAPAGDIAHAIGRRVLALVRDQTGNDPTKANAVIADDLVVVTLADCLSTAEQEVAAAGRGDLALRTRGLLRDRPLGELFDNRRSFGADPVYLAPAPLRFA